MRLHYVLKTRFEILSHIYFSSMFVSFSNFLLNDDEKNIYFCTGVSLLVKKRNNEIHEELVESLDGTM